MVTALEEILRAALERLSFTLQTYLPPLLACIAIILASLLLAVLARWVVNRLFRGTGLDRFLHQSGISNMFGRSGRVRTSALVSGAAYWIILILGFLTGISVFATDLTTRTVEAIVVLMPKVVAAAAILLLAAWLAQYLSRSALIWASNEGIPSPRRLAGAIRVIVMFVGIVVAADYLNFARSVFLAAFIILVGGAVLAGSIALGLGARLAVQRHLQRDDTQSEGEAEKSLWSHL